MSVNTQLVTITVDPEGDAFAFQCVLTLGDYSQERAKTEYNCMSSDDSTVGLGSITRAPMEFTGLYNEDTSDGQDLLKIAFGGNEEIGVSIEFDNPPVVGSNGTTLEGVFGVSKYVMAFPKDGKIGVAFTLEFVDTPSIIPAGSLGAKATGSWDCSGSISIGDGDASLTIGATVIATAALGIGELDEDIAPLVAAAVNAEGSYTATSSGSLVTITSLTADVLENGKVVTDTSTDTGMTVTVTDMSGAVAPT